MFNNLCIMRDVTKQYKKLKRGLLEYDMFFENTFLRLKWNRQALTEGHNLIHDTLRTTNADILSDVDQAISRLINYCPAEYLLSHSFVSIQEIVVHLFCRDNLHWFVPLCMFYVSTLSLIFYLGPFLPGVSGNSRSRPFPRMKASDSLSRIMGMDFFIPFPFQN